MKQIILSTFILILLLSCMQTMELDDDLYSKLQESEDLFQQGLTQDVPLNKDSFFRSASILDDLISREKIENGYIYYNAANSWLNSGQIGKAIISYKKASQLIPNNRNIRNNLEIARSQVQYSIDRDPGNPLLETLFFIHYDLSFQTRFTLMIILVICIFTIASILLFKKSVVIRNIMFILIFCGLLMGISIIISMLEKPEGVVTSHEIISRKGDSEGYAGSFTQPLTEGVEFTLLSERNNWYFIELADGRTCWIPEYAAEIIN